MPQHLGTFKSRKSIAAFLLEKHGLIAGMAVASPEGPILRDSTGRLLLPADLAGRVSIPSWLALDIQRDGSVRVVYHSAVQMDEELQHALGHHEPYRARWAIYQAVRQFFLDRGFYETDTPVAVPNPGSEPYLDTWAIGDRWLRTSPELHMKRLLGMGFDRIFQMGPCFRKGDVGRWHRDEFTMLEWYRCFADLDHIAADLEALLAHLAPFAQDTAYFQQKPRQVTCAALFEEVLGLSLKDHEDIRPLSKALADRGIDTSPDDDWDTLYFLLFLNFIEPELGMDQPVIVTHYPASQAALAKLAPTEDGVMPSCYRLELYVRGLELANAFYELTDATEQRARFATDARLRKAMGKPVYAPDEAFLNTLARGLPPTAGIALGTDRLIAALLGVDDLTTILPF